METNLPTPMTARVYVDESRVFLRFIPVDPSLAALRPFSNRPGRSSSLTAPNGPAQQEVILMAWQEAGLNPGDHQGTAFPAKWMG